MYFNLKCDIAMRGEQTSPLRYIYNMFLFNNLYELLTIVSNLFHRKKIDFELWKTVSNLYKCFEIKMNSFLGYSGEISNKS